jgi:hypothetical protein
VSEPKRKKPPARARSVALNDGSGQLSDGSEIKGMPTGPKGEKRPADVIGAAVKVMRIATGEELEDFGPYKKQMA